MPAIFDQLGVKFHYPENWSIELTEGRDAAHSVSLSSPGGGFWTLSIYPPDADLATLTLAVLQVFQQEFTDLDFEVAAEQIEDHSLDGYNVNFFCFDLTNTALIRGVRTPAASFVLLCQAEDRELAQIEPVFRAITTSLLRNQTADG